MKPTRGTRRTGFSLVEVVMALGVISFAMVGMLGLLSVGFSASKKATTDSNTSVMSAQLVSFLRTSTSSSYNYASLSATTTKSFFFDSSGQLQMTTTGSGILLTVSNSSSAYQCDVQTKSPSTTLVPGSGNFSVMTMTFSWPLIVATKSRRTQEVFYATMPK